MPSTSPEKQVEPTWTIWVCGCPDKVEDEEWARDSICGRCKEPHRQITVTEVHPELRPLLPPNEYGEPQFGEPQELTAHNAVASTFGEYGAGYLPLVES